VQSVVRWRAIADRGSLKKSQKPDRD